MEGFVINPKKIIYREEDGNLVFVFKDEYREAILGSATSVFILETSGTIPKDVVAGGEKKIKRYAKREIRKKVGWKWRKHKKQLAFRRNPNYPISISHEGALLKGRIIYAVGKELRVVLDQPEDYKGESRIFYGLASALSGKHIFKGDKFSDDAEETARNLLIAIYTKNKRREENKGIFDLVEKLNQANR